MRFFHSDIWKRLRGEGVKRANVFAGQHRRMSPRIMRARWAFPALRSHDREKENAKRRRQIAMGQLRVENGLERHLSPEEIMERAS